MCGTFFSEPEECCEVGWMSLYKQEKQTETTTPIQKVLCESTSKIKQKQGAIQTLPGKATSLNNNNKNPAEGGGVH